MVKQLRKLVKVRYVDDLTARARLGTHRCRLVRSSLSSSAGVLYSRFRSDVGDLQHAVGVYPFGYLTILRASGR
jgi:hypothetical protein